MVGQVVVVLDGVERGWLAVQAEVVYRDALGEDSFGSLGGGGINSGTGEGAGERGKGNGTFHHAQTRAEDGHQRDGVGRNVGGRVGEAEWCFVFGPRHGGQRGCKGFSGYDERDLVHKTLDITGAGVFGPELAQLSEQAWVLGDVHIGGELLHHRCEFYVFEGLGLFFLFYGGKLGERGGGNLGRKKTPSRLR